MGYNSLALAIIDAWTEPQAQQMPRYKAPPQLAAQLLCISQNQGHRGYKNRTCYGFHSTSVKKRIFAFGSQGDAVSDLHILTKHAKLDRRLAGGIHDPIVDAQVCGKPGR